MNIKIENIKLDASIQCRAAIDTTIVNDYAGRMIEGDKFPPIELYGTQTECWIGDGWHRVMAAKQIGAVDIPATLHVGGRTEALKHALGANALHGHRRTNADKRRCVELALKEFPKLSNRAIADMCGVSAEMVNSIRSTQLPESGTSTRIGKDGKNRLVKQQSADNEPTDKGGEQKKSQKLGPSHNGMQFARMAIMNLEQIRLDDKERTEAFGTVKKWMEDNENRT